MECVIEPSSSIFMPVFLFFFYEIDVSLSINAFELLSANWHIVAGITFKICLQKSYWVSSS